MTVLSEQRIAIAFEDVLRDERAARGYDIAATLELIHRAAAELAAEHRIEVKDVVGSMVEQYRQELLMTRPSSPKFAEELESRVAALLVGAHGSEQVTSDQTEGPRGTELELVDGAARLLAKHGRASLAYATAQFDPYSSRSRPDLVFDPGPDPSATFFLEYRRVSDATKMASLLEALTDHRDFVADGMTRFAFATDGEVLPGEMQRLATASIEVFAGVRTSEQLAEAVLTWAKAAR